MEGELCITSGYTFLSSTLKIENIIEIAKKRKFKYLGLIDKKVMFGCMEFYKVCKENDIKPIIGCEFEFDNLILDIIAKDNEGYHLLVKLSSLINTENTKLTLDMLKEKKDNIIVVIPSFRSLKKINKENYVSILDNLQNSFPYFYVGMEYYENDALYRLNSYVRELNYKKIYFNNITCKDKVDSQNIDVLEAIKNNEIIGYSRKIDNFEYSYFLSDDEKRNNFTYEELEETKNLISLITLELEKEKMSICKYKNDPNFDSAFYLNKLAFMGLEKRNKEFVNNQVYIDRLNKELDIINKMGFSDYFLIVYDYVKFAKNKGITVGQGRGSAAGSLVAYVLGITNIDPIKYNLLFERFLNLERITMPDIDVDFQDNRRGEIVNYLKDKYGSEHVGNLVTFQGLGAKQVLRDVSKVLGLNKNDIELIARKTEKYSKETLSQIYESNNDFRKLINSDEKYRDVYDLALQIESLPRQASIHPSGIVLSSEPLLNNIPVMGGNSLLVVQYDMNHMEALGLLKMDLLGIRNLTIISDCLKEIKRVYNRDVDLNNIDLNDPKIYELLNKGKTSGIFQLESEGMKKTIKMIRPKCFEDIASVLALYRPGPREFIKDFTLRKEGVVEITYPDPCLEDILKPTYGVMIYQEQIIQVATKFAGFPLSKADILRRAISKKEEAKMLNLKKEFIEGSINNGHSEEKANEVFELILKFANYGFNKSHTVPYAMVAVQMTYLKAHYPSIFFACVMEAFAFGEKFSDYINESKENGITLLLPSVNHSSRLFEAINEKEINYGLSHIKGVSSQFINNIIEERNKEEFKDYINFVVRMSKYKLNDNQMLLLIDSGALDEFNLNRATLKHNYEKIKKYAEMITITENNQISFAFDLVDSPSLEIIEESKEKLSLENEVLGFYISEFPLAKIRDKLEKYNYVSSNQYINYDNKTIKTVLMIKNKKIIKTKKNEMMAITTMIDEFSNVSVVIFPSTYKNVSSILSVGDYVVVEGKIEVKDEDISLIANNIKRFVINKEK